jgi:hypothetical protein
MKFSLFVFIVGMLLRSSFAQLLFRELSESIDALKAVSKPVPVHAAKKIRTTSSNVNGYLTINYLPGSSCDLSDVTYSTGYKSNTCILGAYLDADQSIGSYKVILSSTSSCSGGTITYYSDTLCADVQQYGSIVEDCTASGTTNFIATCQEEPYAPLPSYSQNLDMSSSTTPTCTDKPSVYLAYPLNTCIDNIFDSFINTCVDSVISETDYSDTNCKTQTGSSTVGTAGQCQTSSLDGYVVALCYSCSTVSTSANSSGSGSSGSEISPMIWMFVVIGGIVVLAVLALSVRSYCMRNSVPVPVSGEVKMVTLFSTNPSTSMRVMSPNEARI